MLSHSKAVTILYFSLDRIGGPTLTIPVYKFHGLRDDDYG